MLYTMIYNTYTKETATMIFYSYEELHKAAFSPGLEYTVIDTDKAPPGKTYSEKKNALHDLAVAYSYSYSADHVDGMAWSELFEMQCYFREYGRRYGLLTEFDLECIC